jgi:flagella basal body P-ring formation protein FlgA
MGKKVCLLLLLQFCFWCSSVFAEGIVVTIAEQARVDGTTITLGELAEISGSDAERIQNLRQLKLGTAPIPGGSFVLTKEVITMRLAAAGADLNGITWQIPNDVTVIGNSQLVSGQTLIDKAVAAIRSQVGSSVASEDLTITSVGRVQDVIAPLGNLVFSTSLPYGIRYNTPTTVTVAVTVNERGFSKVGLKFDVKLYRQVAVAARQVNAHEIFTDDCLRYERMDSGQLAAGFVTDKNKIVGLMAKRPVTPGMVVTDSMVNKPFIIRRGAMVTLLAHIAGMEVTAIGQAMQDGCEGQLIRVQNANSNKYVLGKVLNESTVETLTYKGTANP